MPTDITSVLVETLVVRRSPYTAIDPEDAVLEAIADHFAVLRGVRGWPERHKDLDLTGGAVVTVALVESRRTPIAPAPIPGTDLYRTGELEVDAQLDLWAPYRSQRDAAAIVVEALLNNRLPFRHGMLIKSRGYHNRPITARASTGRNTAEGDAAGESEWRRTWLLKAQTDLVADASGVPVQTTITLRPTVQLVAEPDTDIT